MTTGVVVAEPCPIVERAQPLTVAFTTSNGRHVEKAIVQYLMPRRHKGQSIEIQYTIDGDDVLAR